MRPANGSATVLKTNAAVSAPRRSIGGAFFAGDGTPSTSRSSSAVVPRFFVATPQATGKSSPRVTAFLSAARDLVDGRAPRPRGSAPSAPRRSRRRRRAAASRYSATCAAMLGRDRPGLALLAALRARCTRTCAAGRRCPSARARRRSAAAIATHCARAAPAAPRASRKKSARSRSSMLTKSDAREPELVRALPDARRLHLDAHHAADDEQQRPRRRGARRSRRPGSRRRPGVSIRLILRPCHSRCASDAASDICAPLLVLVPVGDGRAGLDGAEAVDRARPGRASPRPARSSGPAVADDGDVADLAGLLCRHRRVSSSESGVVPALDSRPASHLERPGELAPRGGPSGAGSPSCAAARRATR